MAKPTLVLEIDCPEYTLKLYESQLQIDLQGTFKNDLVEALENKPLLKETVGRILGVFIPLHIHLGDIDSVTMMETGKVKIVLPYHRDVFLPLEPKNAQKLVDKLNYLIPKAREEKIERIIKEHTLQKMVAEERAMARASVTPGVVPMVLPEGVREIEKAAKETIEEELEKED